MTLCSNCVVDIFQCDSLIWHLGEAAELTSESYMLELLKKRAKEEGHEAAKRFQV